MAFMRNGETSRANASADTTRHSPLSPMVVMHVKSALPTPPGSEGVGIAHAFARRMRFCGVVSGKTASTDASEAATWGALADVPPMSTTWFSTGA